MLGSSSSQPKARLRRYIWTFLHLICCNMHQCLYIHWTACSVIFWMTPNSHYSVQSQTSIPSHKIEIQSTYVIFYFSVYIVLFYHNLKSPVCIVRLVSFRGASGRASSSLQKTHKVRLVWLGVERVWQSSKRGKNTCISRERLLRVVMSRLEFPCFLSLQDLAHDRTA